jgi:4-amino-4-deoxy-L-arabinose transferase-like glycosyltransferase
MSGSTAILRVPGAVWLTALAVGFATAMLWLVLPPPLFTDSIQVFRAAGYWPHIPAHAAPAHQMTRIGLLLPAAAAQWIFGSDQVAYYSTSAFLMSLFAVGCYLAGRMLFGDRVGLAAVFLILVHPLFTVVDPYVRRVGAATGGIFPDAPAAGLFALGVAALLLGARRRGRRQTGLLVAAGTGFGAAYLCREFIVFMYAAIPVFFWLLGLRLWRVVWVAGGTAVVVAFSLVHNAVVFHDPLATLHASEEVASGGPGVSRRAALGRFFEAMLTVHWTGVFLLIGLALTVAGWVATRDRRLALALVWFLSLWVPLTLAGGLLDPHDPAFDWGCLPRYWIPIYPPLVIGGLGAAVLLVRRIPRRSPRAAAAIAVAAAFGFAYLVPAARELRGVRGDVAWNELRGWLARRQDITRVWTDTYSGQTLAFYIRSPLGKPLWRGRISTFRHQCPLVPDTVRTGPLLHTRYGARSGPSRATGWRLVWRSSDNRTLSVWIRRRDATEARRTPSPGGVLAGSKPARGRVWSRPPR